MPAGRVRWFARRSGPLGLLFRGRFLLRGRIAQRYRVDHLGWLVMMQHGYAEQAAVYPAYRAMPASTRWVSTRGGFFASPLPLLLITSTP